jgi:hypothetical protein
LVIFNEKDGRHDGKSIFLKGQVIVSPSPIFKINQIQQINIKSEKLHRRDKKIATEPRDARIFVVQKVSLKFAFFDIFFNEKVVFAFLKLPQTHLSLKNFHSKI